MYCSFDDGRLWKRTGIEAGEALPTVDVSKPVEYISSVSAIDVDNYAELVGYYDYVFCGTVTEAVGTQYEETEIGGDNPRTDYNPYTVYHVKVIENIKGELGRDKEVTLYKGGGLAKDKKSYILRYGDCLPEAGKTYMFNAWVREDGKLGISGKNSNIYMCEASEAGNIKDHDLYNQFVDAYRNEVKYDMKRYEYAPNN